jgi:hypothetical protein
MTQAMWAPGQPGSFVAIEDRRHVATTTANKEFDLLKLVPIFILCVGFAAGPRAVEGSTLAGGQLPDTITVDDELLRLNGAGLYEAGMFNVDVFVAGLYLEEPTSSAAHILSSDRLRVLALRFKRDVSKQRLVEVARSALGNQSGAHLERFLASLPKAADGDVLTFTHRPRGGLTVAHNGQKLSQAADEALAHEFFTHWVGPEAFDDKLGRQLLGR